MFDFTKQYLEAGKCYNYTLSKTEKKTIFRFYVSSVTEHKTIGANRTCNWSYACIFQNDANDYCDCIMYIWNCLNSSSTFDWYSVRNCSYEEMSPEEAAEFVKGLKNKSARKRYLKD